MKLKDIQSESDKNKISLSKLIGKKIKEVTGYISTEFGDSVFNMCKIVFEVSLIILKKFYKIYMNNKIMLDIF